MCADVVSFISASRWDGADKPSARTQSIGQRRGVMANTSSTTTSTHTRTTRTSTVSSRRVTGGTRHRVRGSRGSHSLTARHDQPVVVRPVPITRTPIQTSNPLNRRSSGVQASRARRSTTSSPSAHSRVHRREISYGGPGAYRLPADEYRQYSPQGSAVDYSNNSRSSTSTYSSNIASNNNNNNNNIGSNNNHNGSRVVPALHRRYGGPTPDTTTSRHSPVLRLGSFDEWRRTAMGDLAPNRSSSAATVNHTLSSGGGTGSGTGGTGSGTGTGGTAPGRSSGGGGGGGSGDGGGVVRRTPTDPVSSWRAELALARSPLEVPRDVQVSTRTDGSSGITTRHFAYSRPRSVPNTPASPQHSLGSPAQLTGSRVRRQTGRNNNNNNSNIFINNSNNNNNNNNNSYNNNNNSQQPHTPVPMDGVVEAVPRPHSATLAAPLHYAGDADDYSVPLSPSRLAQLSEEKRSDKELPPGGPYRLRPFPQEIAHQTWGSAARVGHYSTLPTPLAGISHMRSMTPTPRAPVPADAAAATSTAPHSRADWRDTLRQSARAPSPKLRYDSGAGGADGGRWVYAAGRSNDAVGTANTGATAARGGLLAGVRATLGSPLGVSVPGPTSSGMGPSSSNTSTTARLPPPQGHNYRSTLSFPLSWHAATVAQQEAEQAAVRTTATGPAGDGTSPGGAAAQDAQPALADSDPFALSEMSVRYSPSSMAARAEHTAATDGGASGSRELHGERTAAVSATASHHHGHSAGGEEPAPALPPRPTRSDQELDQDVAGEVVWHTADPSEPAGASAGGALGRTERERGVMAGGSQALSAGVEQGTVQGTSAARQWVVSDREDAVTAEPTITTTTTTTTTTPTTTTTAPSSGSGGTSDAGVQSATAATGSSPGQGISALDPRTWGFITDNAAAQEGNEGTSAADGVTATTTTTTAHTTATTTTDANTTDASSKGSGGVVASAATGALDPRNWGAVPVSTAESQTASTSALDPRNWGAATTSTTSTTTTTASESLRPSALDPRSWGVGGTAAESQKTAPPGSQHTTMSFLDPRNWGAQSMPSADQKQEDEQEEGVGQDEEDAQAWLRRRRPRTSSHMYRHSLPEALPSGLVEGSDLPAHGRLKSSLNRDRGWKYLPVPRPSMVSGSPKDVDGVHPVIPASPRLSPTDQASRFHFHPTHENTPANSSVRGQLRVPGASPPPGRELTAPLRRGAATSAGTLVHTRSPVRGGAVVPYSGGGGAAGSNSNSHNRTRPRRRRRPQLNGTRRRIVEEVSTWDDDMVDPVPVVVVSAPPEDKPDQNAVHLQPHARTVDPGVVVLPSPSSGGQSLAVAAPSPFGFQDTLSVASTPEPWGGNNSQAVPSEEETVRAHQEVTELYERVRHGPQGMTQPQFVALVEEYATKVKRVKKMKRALRKHKKKMKREARRRQMEGDQAVMTGQ